MPTWIQEPFYNISSPAALYAVTTRAALAGIFAQSNGTAGVLTLNDCLTLAEASAANEIFSYTYEQANVGTYPLKWPLQSGLVVSAVPTGMALNIAVEFLIP